MAHAPDSKKAKLTYRDAGVDIDAGDALVERIKGHVEAHACGPRSWLISAASLACARCPRTTRTRCWWPAPTAWAPS